MNGNIRVTVWNEFRSERSIPEVAAVYPEGIHNAIARHLGDQPGFEVRTATLNEPSHGLTNEVLANTDVLIWWGHFVHDEVSDEVAEAVQTRVLEGMGLIVLHSGHYSKVFRKLVGTTCTVKWRENGEKERVWVVDPGHPIANGLGPCFEIPQDEMYGEPFGIPTPDELVFLTWFAGGEVVRSGCCYRRGRGRIFYFQPGHEHFPVYRQPEVVRVIANAARWAAPVPGASVNWDMVCTEPRESLSHQKIHN